MHKDKHVYDSQIKLESSPRGAQRKEVETYNHPRYWNVGTVAFSRRRSFDAPRITEHCVGPWNRTLLKLRSICSFSSLLTIRSMPAPESNSAYTTNAAALLLVRLPGYAAALPILLRKHLTGVPYSFLPIRSGVSSSASTRRVER
jgi:hypothetical protein